MLPPLSQDTAQEPDAGAVFTAYVVPDRAGDRLMLVGELDLVTAARARAALRRAQCDAPELTCDLGDVWFVDLAGLRVLIDATRWAASSGRRLTIANCPPIIPRMLRLLRLRGALQIVATS
jgi:anti-anti-sigma factor